MSLREETLQRSIDFAYTQRNALAVAFVKMALLQGWPAGRGIDGKTENDMGWRHVVYVDMPGGEQVSWHMSPADVYLLDGLPTYRGEWNGTFVAKSSTWADIVPQAWTAKIQCGNVEEYARANLSGFKLKRWLIELKKLDAESDIEPEVKDKILRGYVRSWA